MEEEHEEKYNLGEYDYTFQYDPDHFGKQETSTDDLLYQEDKDLDGIMKMLSSLPESSMNKLLLKLGQPSQPKPSNSDTDSHSKGHSSKYKQSGKT